MIFSVERQVYHKNDSLSFILLFSVDKSDAMRKVIQHIDERNWRTLEYFRMLDKQSKLKLNEKTITLDMLVSVLFIPFQF